MEFCQNHDLTSAFVIIAFFSFPTSLLTKRIAQQVHFCNLYVLHNLNEYMNAMGDKSKLFLTYYCMNLEVKAQVPIIW